jgi:O-antigen/teichoic acid export membrane protein
MTGNMFRTTLLKQLINSPRIYQLLFQFSNLIFQLALIPVLYSLFNLDDIGIVLKYIFSTQIILIFINGGSSILTMSQKEICDSSLLKIQIIYGLSFSVLFLIISSLVINTDFLSYIFTFYLLISCFGNYWVLVKNKEFKNIFISNLFSKLFFSIIFFILIKLEFTNYKVYAISIVLDQSLFVTFNYFFSKNTFKVLKDCIYKKISLKYLKLFLDSSINDFTKFLYKDLDKLFISYFYVPSAISSYNLIYKIIDLPSSILIQFTYTFLDNPKNKKKLILFSSVVSLLGYILINFAFYSIMNLLDPNITSNYYFKQLESLFPFFSILLLIRPISNILSFTNYYHRKKVKNLTNTFCIFIITNLILLFTLNKTLDNILFIVVISEILLLIKMNFNKKVLL